MELESTRGAAFHFRYSQGSKEEDRTVTSLLRQTGTLVNLALLGDRLIDGQTACNVQPSLSLRSGVFRPPITKLSGGKVIRLSVLMTSIS